MMIANTLKFWIYLVLLIPSMICLLFVLYHLLFNRTLRSAINNHVIIVLLLIGFIIEVTIYPWMLYFYQYEGIWSRASIFCKFWGFFDWGLYVTQTILFAWITIERHILIFHDKWVSTRKKRFFVHYLPPVILLLYCLVFYIIVFFFPPCKNYLTNYNAFCIDACLFYNYVYTMWEMIVHQIFPSVIIIVFSIALFVRVLWQKHRKMAVQVLSISLLYLAFFFPFALYNLMLTFGVSDRLIGNFGNYSEFFSYFMTPLLSFICALSLPELRTKLMKILHSQRKPKQVGPAIFSLPAITKN